MEPDLVEDAGGKCRLRDGSGAAIVGGRRPSRRPARRPRPATTAPAPVVGVGTRQSPLVQRRGHVENGCRHAKSIAQRDERNSHTRRPRAMRTIDSRTSSVLKVFNLNGDDWDRSEDRPGWRSKDAWVGQRIGAELIGGSMYELAAGDRLWPYHTHHAN